MLQLLLPMRQIVVATGGGTFAEPDNRLAINIDGVSIWLDVPFAEILARLGPETRRPLAADRARLEWLFGDAPGRVPAGASASGRVRGANQRAGRSGGRVAGAMEGRYGRIASSASSARLAGAGIS